MNPEMLISQLRNVHGPEAIGQWPLAIGWWLLAILIIAAVCSIAMLLRQRYLKNYWKRSAQRDLAALTELPDDKRADAVAAFVRRVLAHIKQDQSLLNVQGESWLNLLKDNIPALDEAELTVLGEARYMPAPPTTPPSIFPKLAAWVKRV